MPDTIGGVKSSSSFAYQRNNDDSVDSTAWMWMAMNYEPTEEMVDFQDRIFAQDAPILESQRPELLPLDLQAELHLRSDRTAIAYRKWLKQLGVRTGAV